VKLLYHDVDSVLGVGIGSRKEAKGLESEILVKIVKPGIYGWRLSARMKFLAVTKCCLVLKRASALTSLTCFNFQNALWTLIDYF
jgi:hypothetical protein